MIQLSHRQAAHHRNPLSLSQILLLALHLHAPVQVPVIRHSQARRRPLVRPRSLALHLLSHLQVLLVPPALVIRHSRPHAPHLHSVLHAAQVALAHRRAVLVHLRLAVARSLHLRVRVVILPSHHRVRVQALASHRAVHLHSQALVHRYHSQAVALAALVIRHSHRPAHRAFHLRPAPSRPHAQALLAQALLQAVHPQVFLRVLVARHFHQAQAARRQAALSPRRVLHSRRVPALLAQAQAVAFHHHPALSHPARRRSRPVRVRRALAPVALSPRRVRRSQVVVLRPVSQAQAPSHRPALRSLPAPRVQALRSPAVLPAQARPSRRRVAVRVLSHRPQALSQAQAQIAHLRAVHLHSARRLSVRRRRVLPAQAHSLRVLPLSVARQAVRVLSALAAPHSLPVLRALAAHPLR